MPYLHRIPEEHEVDESALNVFSRVARWGGFAAAKRIQKILNRHFSDGKFDVSSNSFNFLSASCLS